MAPTNELRVPRDFHRSHRGKDWSIKSAVWLIEHMCAHLSLDDLSATEVLDVGCGVKFSQALINNAIPVKQYVGLDVYRELIDFLRENVDDPRFEYFHIDVHNAMYNPGGKMLAEETVLPLHGRTFDLICLFSVFTHLAPHDYGTMLKVLRRHVKPSGRLFYTLFVDELSDGGHALMDGFARKAGASSVGRIETFEDLDPEHPLQMAVYSRRYALELVEGTGWDVVSLSPPDEYLQHHIVCAPR